MKQKHFYIEIEDDEFSCSPECPFLDEDKMCTLFSMDVINLTRLTVCVLHFDQ